MNKQWQNDAIKSFEEAKSFIIGSGGMKVVSKVFEDIFEVDQFPSEPDTIHPLREETLVKGLFLCHAIAVTKIVDTVIDMLKSGTLEANGDKAKIQAEKLKKKMKEKGFNLDSDEEEEEDQEEQDEE